MGSTLIPQWLEFLLGEKFFIPCLVHENEKKYEKNTFCLDCCISVCYHCLPSHQYHRLLQIRRYVYQDVIRLSDAQKLMDCSSVQPYTTNSAKVLFLHQRAMTRQFKFGSGNTCIVCRRNLQDPFLFCSVSCKVSQLGNTEGRNLCNSEVKGLKIERLEGGEVTPGSVFELPISLGTSSRSSSSRSTVGPLNFFSGSCSVAGTATTEFVKKKRSTIHVPRTRQLVPVRSPETEISDAGNRRKGVARRSPLY